VFETPSVASNHRNDKTLGPSLSIMSRLVLLTVDAASCRAPPGHRFDRPKRSGYRRESEEDVGASERSFGFFGKAFDVAATQDISAHALSIMAFLYEHLRALICRLLRIAGYNHFGPPAPDVG